MGWQTMNHESEMLVVAWMQRREMPAPVLLKRDDGTYEPLGKHDAAIVEAAKRLGDETIQGAYVLRSHDEDKLLQLAKEIDALNDKLLKDSKASISDGQHRAVLKGLELS